MHLKIVSRRVSSGEVLRVGSREERTRKTFAQDGFTHILGLPQKESFSNRPTSRNAHAILAQIGSEFAQQKQGSDDS